MSSKKIFVDSSTLIAFIDRASENHYRAIDAFQRLAYSEYHLYTSNLVIVDTYDQIQSSLGSATAKEFLSTIIQSKIDILYPAKSEIQAALKLVNFYTGRDLKLIDVINAVIMNKIGIVQIFTFNYWSNLLGSTAFSLSQESI